MQPDRDRLSSSYLDLALAGDRPRALATVLDPLRAGRLELSALFDDVLGPAAARIGDLWHTGAITVADEHFATRVTEEALAGANAVAQPPERRGSAGVVLACPPEEQHEVGLRMLGSVLRADGWDVHLLGALTPAGDLAAYAGRVAPAAVALSCGTPLAIPSLMQTVETLRAANPDLPIVLGGRALELYPAIGTAAGASAVFARVGEARDELPRLLADRGSRPSGP